MTNQEASKGLVEVLAQEPPGDLGGFGWVRSYVAAGRPAASVITSLEAERDRYEEALTKIADMALRLKVEVEGVRVNAPPGVESNIARFHADGIRVIARQALSIPDSDKETG